ncbi:calpain-5-like isoform X1 [Dinothrombium tinctorium]|uniref:Calpain-5-like isoform X1 n=1 Tax=Dinothrombium tinctorium TaxID=1965070 RepID=A0A443QTE5_9ACAR|nr:calpain-5-like isoform X1 [Dinothrombium tinctorium]
MAVKKRQIKGKKKRFKKQSFSRLLKDAIDTGVAFNDPEFRADDAAIAITTGYRSKLNVGKIVWKRPREICTTPHLLFREKLGPATEIRFMGHGLNQWLIAAACAIAQDKALVYRIIPKEQFHFLHGAFKVCLWHCGVWYKITIDDKLPTYDNELVFSSSQCGTLFWVPLLEKAFAKFHGNYEKLSAKGSLKDALTSFTAAPTEDICIKPSDDEKDYFRLIAEELDKKSLICAQTRNDIPPEINFKSKRIYLITSVKKPSSASFKKSIKESNATLRLVNTIYEEKKRLSVDNFTKTFETLTICRLNIDQHKQYAAKSALVNMQFCFDITQDSDEVMLDLYQNVDEPRNLGFKIYKVEMNRKYRVHNFSLSSVAYYCEPIKHLSIFRRIKLNFGRYVIVPHCPDKELKLLLRLYTQKPSHLRVLTSDMPRRNLFSFLSPKYPKYVSKIIVKGAQGLEKQDRFGSANPYCVIRCRRKAIKSSPVHDTLNPDWNDFSAIFYHGKSVSIIIEVWHRSFFLNSFVGQAEIIPNSNKDDFSVQEIDLSGRKKDDKRLGTIRYQIFTSEELTSF